MISIKEKWKKIKSSKNFGLIVALILCVVAAVIFLTTLTAKSTSSGNTSQSFSEYNSDLENKLCNVIAAIDGVGKVSVAISYGSGAEKVYAYETKKQTGGGVTTETSALVTVGGQPLVVKEISPVISGVVVVAKGADDPIVRMRIVEAVTTLLDINGNKVQVFS